MQLSLKKIPETSYHRTPLTFYETINMYASELYQIVKIHEHFFKILTKKHNSILHISRENVIINIVHPKISIFGGYFFKTICHDHHCYKIHPRMHKTALY